MEAIRFIDLFAGIGGLRLGFEEAFKNSGLKTECVMTSEIKPYGLKVLEANFSHDYFVGDISKVKNEEIPDFDYLLGGFPCQPFSAAGNRLGFTDTRGTLFFEIERILAHKKPYGFILENVEGLVKHDLENKKDEIGRTLKTIVEKLELLGYKTSWKVLNSADFALPQERKRIFIVGTLNNKVDLNNFPVKREKIKNILEKDLPSMKSKFADLLLQHYTVEELHGKSIKDKRGGNDNIHSWDIGLKGSVSKEQAILLNRLFKERRKKQWCAEIGIDWMDGIPLTLEQIKTFNDSPNLKDMLDDLVAKKYLKIEHPKSLVTEVTLFGSKTFRMENPKIKAGYNIVSGKLSYEINKILDPNGITPTLVATDMARLVVPNGTGLRRMTLREGLRLFGYPEWFKMPVSDDEGFDLLGNTVAVNVVVAVAERLVNSYKSETFLEIKNHSKSRPVAVL
jgi:DNA (cytosine-5)-methyltransferase 1